MSDQYAVSILIKHSLGRRCWLGRCWMGRCWTGRCAKLLWTLDLTMLNELCRYKQQSCADVFMANLQEQLGIASC